MNNQSKNTVSGNESMGKTKSTKDQIPFLYVEHLDPEGREEILLQIRKIEYETKKDAVLKIIKES